MPYLIESGTGRLINISSSGMLGSPMLSPYGAAKAAIWGLGNTLAAEVGVQVSTVQPTAATTSCSRSTFEHRVDEGALGQPSVAVAGFVTWLAHRDTPEYGRYYQVSGVSAARTAFATMPRVRAADWTPEVLGGRSGRAARR